MAQLRGNGRASEETGHQPDGLQVEGTIAFDFSADTRRPDVVKVEFEALDESGTVVFEPTEDPSFICESGQPYDRTHR